MYFHFQMFQYGFLLGKSIIKTLDLSIGECMLIPMVDLIKGNIRLLYSKCFTVQMEGANNLLKFLQLEEGFYCFFFCIFIEFQLIVNINVAGSEIMLPKGEFIRPDILCSTLRLVKPKNFNVNKPSDPCFYEVKLDIIFLSAVSEIYLKINLFSGRSVTANNESVKVQFEIHD